MGTEKENAKLSDSEVLTSCIERAIENGWTGGMWLSFAGDWMGDPPKLEVISPFGSYALLKYTTGGVNVEERTVPPDVMVFDHSFAKALFGEEELTGRCKCGAYASKTHSANYGVHGVGISKQGWQYHLQQLAISEDRIDYLRKWLEEQK